jgi:hypothetical protein
MTAQSGEDGQRQVSDLALERFHHDAEFHARVQVIVRAMLAEGYEPKHSLRRTVAIALYVNDRFVAALTGGSPT